MVEKNSLLWQQIARAILIRCDEKEKQGITSLYESDISDIQDILKKQGVSASCHDVQSVLDSLLA